MSLTAERKQELDVLANDILAGKVFGSWNVDHSTDIGLVFMILALMSKEQLEELKNKGVAHFYEYLSQAGPRSVNGYPCFFSFRSLTAAESEYVRKRMELLNDALAVAKQVPID